MTIRRNEVIALGLAYVDARARGTAERSGACDRPAAVRAPGEARGSSCGLAVDRGLLRCDLNQHGQILEPVASRQSSKLGEQRGGVGGEVGHRVSSVVSHGEASCSEAYRLGSPAPLKSTDRNCSVPTELSDGQNSILSPDIYGFRQTQLRSSPSSEAPASEQPNDGCRVKSARPIRSSKPQTTRYSGVIGND